MNFPLFCLFACTALGPLALVLSSIPRAHRTVAGVESIAGRRIGGGTR